MHDAGYWHSAVSCTYNTQCLAQIMRNDGIEYTKMPSVDNAPVYCTRLPNGGHKQYAPYRAQTAHRTGDW